MKKLKILQVIKSLGRGGAETLLVETLRLHDKERIEFHYIYFLPWKNQLVDELEAQGSHVTCLAARNNIALLAKLFELVQYVRANNIDLIHAHLPWAGVVARLAGRWTGVPVVYTEHNKQERYHTLTRFINLSTLKLATRIIAVSEDVAQSIRKHKPKAVDNVITLLNGVNVNHFSRQGIDAVSFKRSLAISEDSLVVGTVAVFRVQKKLDLWLEVASRLTKTLSNVHFLIVGDGPLKNMILERVDALGLNQHIHLAGLQKDVRPYLATMDLYMMSSKFEGLPIALLEAMSMECPVVTTNAGGVGEVVRNGIDGLVTEIDGPAALYELAFQILKDSNLRLHFARASRNRVLERFTMGEMVRKLEGLYFRLAY